MLPLHWKSCFDRNTPHITEFATVAKSLPHSLRKAHKSLISNIFLFQYRFFRQNTTPERAWRFFDKKFEFLIPSLPLPQATKMTPDAVLDGGMETEAYA